MDVWAIKTSLILCLALVGCSAIHRPKPESQGVVVASYRNAVLTDELLQMAREDQAARKPLPFAPQPGDPLFLERLRVVDSANTTRLKEIVEDFGWPGNSLVGHEAAHAAWLIVQHSADHQFQERCCRLMKQAVEVGEAAPVDLAYLTDRVRIHAGLPQLYGTQLRRVAGKLEPYPIEDAAGVGPRRAAVGLSSLDEYIQSASR